MKRILFISWPKDGIGAELSRTARLDFVVPGFFDAKTPKWWDLVFPTDINALKHLSDDRQIYVMGHCKRGYQYLDPVQGEKGKAHRLRYDEVCEKLIGTGLRKEFRGVIKFYNCESGLDGQEGKAFAKLAAQYLAANGYKQCTLYGYAVCPVGYVPSGGGSRYKGGIGGNRLLRAGDWKVHCGGPARLATKRGVGVETFEEL